MKRGETEVKEGAIQEIDIGTDGQVVVRHSLDPKQLKFDLDNCGLLQTGDGMIFMAIVAGDSWFFYLLKPMIAAATQA